LATNARIPYRHFFDRRAIIARSINQVLSLLPGYACTHRRGLHCQHIGEIACKCGLAVNLVLGGMPVPALVAVRSTFSLPNCQGALPDFLVSVAADGGSSCLDSCNRAKPQMIRVSCRIFRVRTRLRTRRKGDPESESRISQPDRMTPGSSVGGSLMVCRSEWSRTTSEKLTVATREPASL
jgi:hypothetical protein